MKTRTISCTLLAFVAGAGLGCGGDDPPASNAGADASSMVKRDARAGTDSSPGTGGVDAAAVDAAQSNGGDAGAGDGGVRNDGGTTADGGNRMDAGGGADGARMDAGGTTDVAPPSVPDGLVGYWRLDEKSGTKAADHSGKGNDGTLAGLTPGSAWTAGKLGGGLTASGNGIVRVPNSLSLNGIFKAVTIAGWVQRPTGTPIAGIGYMLARSSLYGLGLDAGRPYFTVGGTGKAPVEMRAVEAIAAAQWVHVAGTWDGMEAKLFVNGNQVATLAYTGELEGQLTALGLGGRPQGNNATNELTGKLDDLRLYSRALSANEVKQLASEM